MDDDYNYSGGEAAFIGTVNQDQTPQETVSQQPGTKKTGPSTYENTLGKRLYNPLAAYSSYNYQLSLYMITPDAYDVFVRNGRRDIEIVNQAGSGCGGGAYLIAQSGGINNETTTRAPGFHYDYGIDNFVIDSVVSPSGTSSPTTSTKCSFTIIEQYGFSFISNLKRAKDSLDAYSTTVNLKDSSNASRQFFVIGVQFLGYDKDGNVFTGPEHTYKRYYDIGLTKINFKIDGKATTYQIEAVTIPPQMAMGQKRGVIDQGANQLTGSTVEELCNALCEKLNNDQNAAVPKDREFPNIYKVDFKNAPEIGSSKIVTSLDLDKIKWPMTELSSKLGSNPNASIKSQPNKDARIMAFNKDTPIIQALQTIINQSTYLLDGLKSAYSTDKQPNEEGNNEPIDSNKRIKWFNISPLISDTKFDRKLKDHAFTITYVVTTYETPIVLSTTVDKTSPYYGPFKRYDYWLTGQNSEIIKYEQTMNNAFFTVALSADGAPDAATGGKAATPIALNKRTPVARLGKLDLGMEAQNNYVTSLVDPGAYAKAEIDILGDPDFLPNDMPTGNPELDTTSKTPFYGPDGYSLDSRNGQVFIEIDFKEAVDYNHDTGYLRVNDKILFWEYPPSVQEKVKGISYQLIGVKSSFRGGRFTQKLDLTLNTFGNESQVPYSETPEGREEAQKQAEAEKQKTVGLKQDTPPSEGTAGGDPCGPSAVPQPTNQETTNSGVADDDSSPTAGIPVDALGNPTGGGFPGV